MQTTVAMTSDIKALLTLLLLKTGTTSQDIHTTLQVASASRVMMAEEHAGPLRTQTLDQAQGNVAKIRPQGSAETVNARRMRQAAEAMNSDIKALLALMLLKSGALTNEIQTALRMAAASRVTPADEGAEAAQSDDTVSMQPMDMPAPTARQVLRNDHLAPMSLRELAA